MTKRFAYTSSSQKKEVILSKLLLLRVCYRIYTNKPLGAHLIFGFLGWATIQKERLLNFTIFSHTISVSLLSINKAKKNTALNLYRVFTIFFFFGGGALARAWAFNDTFGHQGGRLIRVNTVCDKH